MAAPKTEIPRYKLFPAQRWVGVAILVLLGVGAYLIGSSSGAPANYSDPALISRGAELFALNCATCHGTAAIGENAAAVKGGSKPGGGYWAPALNGTAHAWHHPPDGLFQVIKEGSPARDSSMRGWKGSMSDREIHGVIAYMQSLWPEALRKKYHAAFSNQ